MNVSNGRRPLLVQIMPKEKFTKGFIMFTNDAFPDKDIKFIICGSDDFVGYMPTKAENVFAFDNLLEMMVSRQACALLAECDLIVLNSVFAPAKQLLACGRYTNKLLLLFWGGDIYPRQPPTSFFVHPRAWVNRVCLVHLIRHAKGVATLVPGDLDVVEHISPKHGEWFSACVPGRTHAEALQQKEEAMALVRRPKPVRPTRILLGNSATDTNRHGAMLEALSRYAKEDIEVYVPLSYGDPDYRDEIIAMGKRLLGDKFIPIVEFMDKDDYIDFLKSISIGVFNHSRQQGMGNINMLMLFGAKLYLSSENPMWNDFAEEGKVFFNSVDIGKIAYDEFLEYNTQSAQRNFEVLNPVKAYEEAKSKWTIIYDSIATD